MDKEQKEIELKKLEVEKLKVRADILRTVIIALLAIGTGIGTVLYRKYKVRFIDDLFLIVLLTLGILFIGITLYQWIKITIKLKELDKWRF